MARQNKIPRKTKAPRDSVRNFAARSTAPTERPAPVETASKPPRLVDKAEVLRRISVRAARDGRGRAPACREARSIACKHPFRKVRSCERGLSSVMSGPSASDTSHLPWRGACLRRSRSAARAQRTLQRVIIGERAAELLKARHQTWHEHDSEFSVHGEDRQFQFVSRPSDH
jgi:hypothetical protein